MKKNTLIVTLALGLTAPSLFAKSDATLPVDEIRNFVDVYHTIRNEYVEEKDGKALIDYAIEGMLSELDPHSAYLKKDDLEELQEETSGSYLGFGFSLDMVDDKLIIVSPIPNSPADTAGLLPNDRIIKIDDMLIEQMTLEEVSQMLDEPKTMTFTILRKGEAPRAVELTKTTVNLPSVTHKIIDKRYGYIQVTQFQGDTDNQFMIALQALLDANIEGLVLDLRNNPGGLLDVAIRIADTFLDAGLIVSTKNPNTGSEEKNHASEATLAKDLPLVVMINEGSASASELVAGALQSHKRAIVVGQRSFGKGSVQTILPLGNGNAVKLTTARYYTPNGESIQAKGITPDIVLSQLTVEKKDTDLLNYGEADIPNHLEKEKSTQKTKAMATEDTAKNIEAGENNVDETTPEKISDSTTDNTDALAQSDLQLFEALNVLKVLLFKQ